MERIERRDVLYQWHIGYEDGPLSGVCLWRGVRYRFQCVEWDWRPTGGVDEDGEPVTEQVRVFHLVELTPEEWAYEDERHESFRAHVGTHTDYDPVTQRRNLNGVKPQAEWSKHYDRYGRRVPTGAERARWAARVPVAWYED